MKNKLQRLIETTIYFVTYLLCGILGNIVSLAVLTAVVGFDYIYNHMTASESEFFAEVMSLNSAQPGIALIFTHVIILVAFLLAFSSRKISFSQYIGLKKPSVFALVVSILAGFFLNLVISNVINLLSGVIPAVSDFENTTFINETNIIILSLATIITGPIIEEFVFRGVLLSTLKKAITPVGALLITSVLFAVVHGNFIQGAYAFVLGIILSFIRIRSRNIWNAVCMHISFNAAYLVYALGVPSDYISLPVSCVITLVLVWIASKDRKKLKKDL